MHRVLYLADELGNGGAERQLALLVKSLSSEWQPRVFSLEGGPYAQILRQNNIQLDLYERYHRYDLGPVVGIWNLLVQWRPTLVHSWGWLCSAVTAPMCKLLRIPFIDGSIRIGGAPRQHYWRSRLTLALADRVIANSHAGLTGLHIPSRIGRVVYNGIDPERLIQFEAMQRDNADFIVVMAARMSPVKDFDTFINAARVVVRTDPSRKYRFLAIGAGTDRVRLMERNSDLIIKGLMEFPDAGIEVMPYLRRAHAGVLMTNPNMLQEAVRTPY